MPNVDGAVLVYDQPIYDTIHLAAAAANGSFFSIPKGGAIGAGVKNLSHTNLVQAGRLEPGNELTIEAMTYAVINNDSAGAQPSFLDTKAVISGSLELKIGNVTFHECAIAEVPSGASDIVFFSNIAAAVTEFNVQTSNSVFQNKYLLPHPIQLKSQETIEVIISNFQQAIAAATRVRFVLWGTATRPVR